MAHDGIDRNRASSIAMSARAGACILAVCGMAIAVFGVPGASSVTTVPRAGAATSVDAEVEPVHELASEEPTLDARGIAARLASVGNAPVPPPEVVVESTGNPDEDDPVPEVAVADEVSFLGLIREPNRVLALMRVNGRQTIMWIGREVNGVKLAEIGEGFVSIEHNGVSKRIDRSERKGEMFTRLQPAAPVSSVPGEQSEQVADVQDPAQSEMSREELLRRVREQARGGERRIRRPPGMDREQFGDPDRSWREDR